MRSPFLPLIVLVLAASAATAADPPFPAGGCLWGAWNKNVGTTWGAGIRALESRVGRTFAIVHNYHQWTQVVPTAEEIQFAAEGRILLINMKPPAAPSWARVASGAEDAQIDLIASRFRAIAPHPILFAFHHEPEDDVGTYGSVQDYADAFRHIHDRFAADGVTNVSFVWNVMGYSGWYGQYTGGLYPGDAYVDCIAYDCYNWLDLHHLAWRSADQTIRPFYDWLIAHGHGNKPFMLGEFGSREDPADAQRKGQWFRDVPGVLATLPNLKAAVYFNSDAWWVDSSAAAFSGYIDAGHAAYVDPRAAPPVPDAQVLGVDAPETLGAGVTAQVVVALRNSGTATWSPGAYALQAQDPLDGATWGAARIALPRAVAPGERLDLGFAITAPAAPGDYRFQWRMIADGGGGFGAASDDLTIHVVAGVGRPLPGAVEAEDYDGGGEGVGYHDTTPRNLGGQYRADAVDIEACADGGCDVGWTATGEWLAYTVDVAASGSYDFAAKVASLAGGAALHAEIDGAPVGAPLPVGATGGWQSWTAVGQSAIPLRVGRHRVRIVIDAQKLNLDRWSLTPAAPAAGG